MSQVAENRLLPRSFIAQYQRRSKEDFVATFWDTYFLLVRLDDVEGELASALSETLAKGGLPLAPTYNTLDFATPTMPPVSAPSDVAARRVSRTTSLEVRLVQAPHFAMPLRKRRGGMSPFESRISVGRTSNNDLVLRDATVSKFHAWFACGTDRRLYLIDAASKNSTKVNGIRIAPQTAALVEPGDEVRFGNVEGTLYHPEVVWRTLASGPGLE